MAVFTNLDALQEFFTDRYEHIVRTVSWQFRHFDPDRKEEAIANTVGLAWKALHRLFEQGRATERMLGTVVAFSIKQTKSGRTVQGTEGRICKCAMDYHSRGRLKFEWIDLDGFLGRGTPIPEQVSFRLDVPRFFATLDDRQQRMAVDLALGETTSTVAKRIGVTPGAVSQFRRRFKVLFDEFFEG